MSRAEPSIAPRPGTTESSKLHRRALGAPDLIYERIGGGTGAEE